MTLPEHLRPRTGVLAVAPDRWRELGVTHWHCVEREPEKTSDSRRFDHDRMRIERVRSSVAHVGTPHEVVDWLTTVSGDLAGRYDLQLPWLEGRREIWQGMAEHGMDVCRILAVSGSRVVHYNAYAMTATECTVH